MEAEAVKKPKKAKKSGANVTALENYAKIDDGEMLIKLLLDEQLNFFDVFESEIDGRGNDRRQTIAILRIFKVVFSEIVEEEDEQRKNILKKTFDSEFFKSDIRFYLIWLEEHVKRDIKDDHKDALQGYYYFLQSLDKVYFNLSEVRLFLEEEFTFFEHILKKLNDSVDEENVFEIREPLPRINQKPIGTGVESESKDGLVCDYRNLPIFPTPEDINTDQSTKKLRKNLVKESYKHVNHYLDTQFRLLREVLVRPLREGIHRYRDLKSNKVEVGEDDDNENFDNDRDLLVYYDFVFLEACVSRSGLIFKVTFDASRLKQVDWEDSSRLLPGSILCLSCDDFKTFFFVVVADRRGVEKGELSVAVMIGAENEDLFVDLFALTESKKYVAVESVTYYEAYRHSLQCLKDFNYRMEFPFKDYIVDVSMSVSSPLYLQEPAVYNLTSTAESLRKDCREGYAESAKRKVRSSQLDRIDITKHATEIPWDLMDLDESQFHAFHAALTRKFVVIQGPPGTGKTYTALRIVQALLDNRKHWCGTDDPDFSCPILILSYKNHALDQFLEGIARFQFDRQIIRVGGNTKSEVIKRMSLYERRKQWEEILEKYKRHESLDAFGHRVVRMVPTREIRRQRQIPYLIRKLFNQLEKMIVSYKQIKLGYKFAGLDICPYVCELDYNVGVQLGFAKYSLSVDKQRAAEIDSELSRNIMEWLEIDDLIDIDDYRRITMEMVNQSIQRNSSAKNTKANGHEEHENADEVVDEIDAKGRPTAKNLQNQRHIDPDEYLMHPDISTFGAGLFLNVNFEEELSNEVSDKRKQAIRVAKDISDKLQSDDCMDESEADKIENVKKLNIKDRWRLYRYFLQKYFADVRKIFDKVHEQIKLLHQELNYLKIKFDHRICREAWVVGMTTTGAAKYRKLVEFLRPKIVIVEEAAEILEAHVVSILTSCTQHLILIGDHQQLRPIPGVQELATKYNMDISLFERMVINGMTCFQLQNQHRMRPEISSLIRGHIYKTLIDHHSVEKRDPIPYTRGKSVFFLNHNENEDRRGAKHGFSSSNTFEAEFAVELARYFTLRNVDPSKITILTTYNAQLEKIKNIILNNYYHDFVHKPKGQKDEKDSKPSKPEFKIRISSVDGFQGEENDIIIISFVRSNDRDDIGFLDIPNRVCVALSRARRGLFCFGNFDSMKRKSDLWEKICGTLEKQKALAIGTELELGCKCKKKSFKKPQTLKIFNGLIGSHYRLCQCKELKRFQ